MSVALQTHYRQEVAPKLRETFGYANLFQVPKLSKVVLNVGFGRHVKEANYKEQVVKTLSRISGQKPVLTKAKKSISNFKIREGMEIGAMVTLRGPAMYDFLYKLVHLTLPRVRDFRGLSPKGFDGKGNYTFGFKENLPFPEMGMESADIVHGLQVVVSTTASRDDEALALLTQLGFPFKEK